jgi:hypothetical protein
MKKLMSTLFVIAAAAGMAMAADKPDFSGNWKADLDKSTFGPQGPPPSLTSKVMHKDPELSVETTTGDQVTTMKYSTDGKETVNSMMGNEMKSKAVWEGKVLVVNSTVDFGGAAVKLVARYSLSEDGKTLTQALAIASPQGDFDMNIVMTKQ